MNKDIKVLDQEQFERVWGRVMPHDRPDCPFTLNSPQTRPGPRPIYGPSPQQPGAGASPNLTVAPQSPGPLSSPAPLCLGEESRDELPALEKLFSRTAKDTQVYLSLSRRWPGEAVFRVCARTKNRQVGQLRAAWYLIDGKFRRVVPSVSGSFSALYQTLRTRHRMEQEIASVLLQEATLCRDPCLVSLYQTLAQENQTLAARIRKRLAQ